jgi:hypothetical protein
MAMTEHRNDINTLLNNGDYIGSDWRGPLWTPYSERIANHYRRIVPWYCSISSGLSAPPSRNTNLTRPHQHDVLIFGCSAFVANETVGNNGQFIYLQVTHEETGLTWAAPNVLNSAPLPAYAGTDLNRTPLMRLPDAFFLPKYTTLRLDWSAVAFADQAFDARLTFAGVQLIDPFEGHAPSHVTMPSGEIIRVGNRIPWFGTTGLGRRSNAVALEGPGFFLGGGEQRAQYLPSVDCDVEIHSLYTNFINTGVDVSNLVIKVVDMGTDTNWNPTRSPVASIFGSEFDVNPALPFVKPYLLKKDHRINIVAQNNVGAAGASIDNGLMTLRGVRLCEF